MILITGTSGHLGRLVVEQLAQRVDPAGIVATARSLDKIADLAELGVVTRELDYDRPDTIASALDGVSQVLLVSSSDIGRRVAQHTAVIEAAVAAGVEHVAYTSILRADTSALFAAVEHRGTEEILAKADLVTTRLRHGWYIENYTENLASALEHGAVIGSAGEGRIAAATRADYAAADVAVLLDPSLRGGTYELGGHAFTMAEYAAVVSELTGREIPYIDLPAADFRAALVGAGLPEPLADFLVDADVGIAKGELDTQPATLEQLAWRTLTTLREAVAAAIA
jgi:NAD(P)H dehydrogenase (quinone)